MVPIDKNLIEINMLNKKEKRWLNSYHKKVFNNIRGFMNKLEMVELKSLFSYLNFIPFSFLKDFYI